MSRQCLLINACILLAVIAHASTQYIDFFQNFNSFLQPLTTAKPRNDATKRPDTKHRQANKQKYQDAIFFETDEFVKRKDNSRIVDPFNLFPTTTKPRRKNAKTSTSPSDTYTTLSPDLTKPNKSINSNKIINNNRNNHEVIRSISNNNGEPYNNNVNNRVVNNGRRYDIYNGYNSGFNNFGSDSETTKAVNNIYGYQGGNFNSNDRQTTQRTTATTGYYNNARQTTRKTTDFYNNARQTTRKTTDFYNNARQTTRKTTDFYNNGRQTTRFYENERTTRRPTNNRGVYNSRTTSNPLLNRPGVKPAVVDENKPPITNRPVTTRPVYDRPFDSGTYRPVNTRLPYETERPRPNRPPVNTRPPFETERPISSGVVRPISGVNRPTVGGNRPTEADTGKDLEPDIEIGPDEDEMSDSEKRRLYDICEQKCEEYKSARVKKVVALPLSPNSQGVELNVSSCPLINIPLIIGGEVARIEQFPHMALVGWKKIQNAGYSWKCGGSLVSEQFILTAGHCTYHDKDYNVVRYYGPPHAVQLGSSLYNDRRATIVQISLVIRHPKYKLRRSYYDVALIKMTNTVSFSDKISPACLGVPPSVGDPIIATGWGKTEYGGDSSIELRSVSIPVWDMTDCREIWGTSLKLPNGPMPDNQICAGERKGAKDTCQGDSGGPAQVQDGCSWRVVAVTSVGRSCGAPETPALYARIPRAFIASQVFTNAKPGRDGNNQYGNEGINANNNWGSANSNSGNANFNSATVNNDRENNNNNNGQFNNQGAANVRPVQNNNGNYYGDNQGSSNNNWGGNNSGNYGSTEQNTRNNDWSAPVTTYNNGYNQNNRNVNNQNNRNVHDQNSYVNNANQWTTTTTTTTAGYNNQNYNGQNGYNNANSYGQDGYNNANSYGQNGYNNEQSQNVRNTQDPFNTRNPAIQSYAYDNGNTGITYNRDNNNGYNSNPVVNQQWWTK